MSGVVGRFCPKDYVEINDAQARFCHSCGEPVAFRCPHGCGQLMASNMQAKRVFMRCTGCDKPIWQCKTCGFLALPGVPACENPTCPSGSLRPEILPAGMAGGDSGRSGAYRVAGSAVPGRRFLGNELPFYRLSLPGRLRAVAAGTGVLWAVTDQPEGLWRITLPERAAEPRRDSVPFGSVPVDSIDALATFSDQLYLLTKEGAVIRSENNVVKEISGQFVAQCIHEAGWALVEHVKSYDGDPGSVWVHRHKPDGGKIAEAVAFPEQGPYPEYSLPVANAVGAYLVDEVGCVWLFPWDGTAPRKIAPPPKGDGQPRHFSLLLIDNQLFVLPIVSDGVEGLCIDLRNGATLPVAPVNRSTLAGAAAPSPKRPQLWVGNTGAFRLACLNRHSPTQQPDGVPGTMDAPSAICTVTGPGDVSAVIAAFHSEGGDYLRGAYCEPPYNGIGRFPAALFPAGNPGARLLVSGPWLAAWKSGVPESAIMLYHLLDQATPESKATL